MEIREKATGRKPPADIYPALLRQLLQELLILLHLLVRDLFSHYRRKEKKYCEQKHLFSHLRCQELLGRTGNQGEENTANVCK